MHSSRMRTVRCSSRLLGGDVCPGGCLPRGVFVRGVSAQDVSAWSVQGGGVCLVCPGGVCLVWTATPQADTPPGRHHPGQTHPPHPVHAGIRSKSGRYASHWNAFLSSICSFFKHIHYSFVNDNLEK